MARDQEMIAALHSDRLAAFELQDGVPTKDQNPFIIALIVPEAGRTAVGVRNDPLDFHSRALEQGQKVFAGVSFGNVSENILTLTRHLLPLCPRCTRNLKWQISNFKSGDVKFALCHP
jgi:hypothetical protein